MTPLPRCAYHLPHGKAHSGRSLQAGARANALLDCRVRRLGGEKTTQALDTDGKSAWHIRESDPTSARFYSTRIVRAGKSEAAKFRVMIVSETAASARAAEELSAARLAILDAIDRATLEQRRLAWWKAYWEKGWIRLEGDSRAEFLEHVWYVNLYAWANVGFGPIPPKFNGGPGLVHGDSRCWGAGLWYQNTRELIWPMCAAGHPDFVRNLLEFYDSFLAESRARQAASKRDGLLGGTRLWETTPIGFSPLANTNAATARPEATRPYRPVSAADRAAARAAREKEQASFTSHVFSSGTELLQQMFDYMRFTGDRSFVPTLATWLREQTELYLSLLEKGDDGLFHIRCTNVNESWWKKDDSIVDLAAARFCLAQTVALGSEFGFPKELIADTRLHLDAIAPFPTLGDYKYDKSWSRNISGVQPGDRIWAPCIAFTNGTIKKNCEYNQLYLVFPFAMAHADAPDTDPVRARACATYDHLPEAKSGGWGWSPVAIDAVRLHLTNAADIVYSHARATCIWPFGGGKSPASPLYPGAAVEDAPYFDGTGVMQTGVQEMLLQSHAEEPSAELYKGGELKLIPDVPKSWRGAFRLRARGGIEVECEFANGEVLSKRITPVPCETSVSNATLAPPFSDGMVLQRDLPVAVWGTADPGTKVTVAFAGQVKTTFAASDGAWRLTLDPLAACAEGRDLRVNDLLLHDVVVGEVWLAAGQSNMELPLWSETPRYRDGKGAMIAQMTRQPLIRFRLGYAFGQGRPWEKAEPKALGAGRGWSSLAFWFARELKLALDVPVGILAFYQGGTPIEKWTPGGELFDKGVAPFAPYTVRGFIWYQGCANGPKDYCQKLHKLYHGWTNAFERASLPMHLVQIPDHGAALQLEQSRFADEEPNAAVVVINDVGNAFGDEHPPRKEIVAQRLALQALKRVYGFDGIEADAPRALSATREGEKVRVTFAHAQSLYVYNDDFAMPDGFEIAGPDQIFHPARVLNMQTQTNAQGTVNAAFFGGIAKTPELLLDAPGVTEPIRVRYLFQRPCRGSVFSEVNLPMSAFELSVGN